MVGVTCADLEVEEDLSSVDNGSESQDVIYEFEENFMKNDPSLSEEGGDDSGSGNIYIQEPYKILNNYL